MKSILFTGASLPALFSFCACVLAQPGPPAASFAPVTGLPTPILSASGRFSSLNPPNQLNCGRQTVSGLVVSSSLIMVKDTDCGRRGHDNVLVNVHFSDSADAAQMVTGRGVTITASFKSAEEYRDPAFYADFVIADKAKIVGSDPRNPSASPVFTSYMMCQPPELDDLVRALGKELCVQSTLVKNLTAARPALEMAARTPANASPTDIVADDPSAISCRLDPKRSDSQLPAIACARGSYWAWYRAKWPDPLSSTPAPP